MESLTTPELIALAGALGWASGVRLYLVVFLTGLAGYLGWFALPAGLHLLAHPAVLIASGFMLFIEFFADKIPGLDSLWDIVHTVIRVPAGAALAAGVFGADHGAMALVARTVQGIADIRASDEGREGIQAFLQKRKPSWLLGNN